MKTFLVSWYKNGSMFGSDIQAEDFADAEAKVAQLPHDFAKVDGELISTVPVTRPLEGRN